MARRKPLLILFFTFCLGLPLAAQEDPPKPDTPAAEKTTESLPQPPSSTAPKLPLPEPVEKIVTRAEEEANKIATQIDQDPNAKFAAAGILRPIYWLAETLAFPAFHWLAFALMSAGVISFALQLVLGKIVVLMRMGFSLKEIISDAIGLAISVVGLVLTTQAATENSTFTRSPAAVITATVAGVVVGFILYRWGQTQEVEAAAGRTAKTAKGK